MRFVPLHQIEALRGLPRAERKAVILDAVKRNKSLRERRDIAIGVGSTLCLLTIFGGNRLLAGHLLFQITVMVGIMAVVLYGTASLMFWPFLEDELKSAPPANQP